MEKWNIPFEVSDICQKLEDNKFEAHLVGGCVRDLILDLKPKDWDITTNASPEEIIGLFQETFYENEYGTVGVVNQKTTDETLRVIEVTPYRIEGEYSDKRRPDSVIFSKNLLDDLKRRDFTINAISLRLTLRNEKTRDKKENGGLFYGEITDPYDGHADIKRGLIKAVGKPSERLGEDALRALRAIRIGAEYGFTIENKTAEAILAHSGLLKHIARERIRDEFFRIVMSPRPLMGLELTRKLKILPYIAPEFDKSVGVGQNSAHSFDVWEHSLRSLQHAADKNWSLEVRLAALLHDMAKPDTKRWETKKKDWSFYGHDVVGARKAQKILENLRVSGKTTDTVTKLVRWHMFFSDTEKITLSAVRRLLSKVGKDLIWHLMDLRACDRIGTGRPKESPYRLRKYKSMIEEVMRDPVSVAMLAIDGKKIIEIGKLSPEPRIGYILHILLEEVLEDPKKNSPELLEKRVRELCALPEKELELLGKKSKERKEEEEEKDLTKIRKKYFVS